MRQRSTISLALWFAFAVGTVVQATAGDWPQWRCDAGHSAASPHGLPDQLHLQWSRQYSPRVPVWDDALNRDMMPYDRIFEPVVADGRLLLSFNDADKVAAFDVRDGSQLWAFYADGPVRFPPVVHGDSVLFTSDDGFLYSVAAADGQLRWRFLGGPNERKVIGNQRVISSWPARGGPVVADDTVYFAASIWPFMGTFIYALDANTGQVRWRNEATGDQYQKQPHSAPSFGGVAPQGQLAVSGDLVLVPGGRSLPAAFDRKTGMLRFFNFGGKGQGGSFVAADAKRAYVHTRVRGTMSLNLPQGTDAKFQANEPVLAGETLYTATGDAGTTSSRRVQAYDAKNKMLWEIDADGTGDLILAGGRLVAAGGGAITAIDLPDEQGPARIAWKKPVPGDVCRLVAASDRLFAVTLDGQILAFGAEEKDPVAIEPPAASVPDADAAKAAERLLKAAGNPTGYALWFGIEDGKVLEAVAAASDLCLVGIDPDAQKIDRLRRQMDQSGWYGRRIALQPGEPNSYMAPPYMAELIVVEPSALSALRKPQQLARLYESLRPYGGKLVIQNGDSPDGLTADDVAAASLEQARVSTIEDGLVISRDGPLPGSAPWTHAYGDVANTVKSNDRRVRLPLGLLWFGGSSNEDVLPRHGHGPSQQVLDGRLFIQGMNSLSARDVYTGRVLWKREFEDLGTFHVYYDESYADTPLSTAYNQLHIPGANLRGTNYVAAEEGVYLVIRDRCLLLDNETGQTLREFVLPPNADGNSPDWGYIGIYGNLLLAGTGFADYTGRLTYTFVAEAKRGVAWSPDRSASLGLLAFDRKSGEIAWRIDAQHSFLHNGIVAGGGRIYLLDKLPNRVEEHKRKRGIDAPATYRLLAVEARTGEPVWSVSENVFGTWLSYAESHDLLLQAGAAASDRSPDEVGRGLSVHRAGDGSVVWNDLALSYAGPCILHNDTLITNTTSYRESKGAFHLLDGSPITVADPVTGQDLPWRFTRTYGCNTAVASEHLLTFRSGAAGFYDLTNHGGTGNLGGFKSSCSSNLIVADGVLNAPEYTRTCTCAYQNQTSLALVPMPENEYWTYGLFGRAGDGESQIRRIGINFGAPGDRLSDEGTWWVNHPPDEGMSPELKLRLEGEPRWFRLHSSRVFGDGLAWVAASGGENVRKVTVQLAPSRDVDAGIAIPITASQDDAEESAAGAVSLTSSDLELTKDKSDQTIGLRFPNIPLRPGAKIKQAFVQFQVDEASDEPTKLEIRGHATDNAPAFTTEAYNVSRRPVTEAVATWEPKAWTANAKPGADHRTPDLSRVIQEIVDRPGWKSGNALALIIRGSGKRVATAADNETKGYPSLLIELDDAAAAEIAAPAATSNEPSGSRRRIRVRLTFTEPNESVRAGDRVFDVALQGQTAISRLDIVSATGGPWRSLVRTFDGVSADDATVTVTLDPVTALPPVLSGIEIIEEE
ncbi:MAG: PQQ-binding-like beta-propeller repeat protein [Pirellulaceae bacterium]|nr:PQQ-binding-like beta-propeller repeat protein [Pirellulaceae bacterium]